MIERVVDISEHGGYVHIDEGRLIIQRGEEKHSLPLASVGVLLMAHPQITISQVALAEIVKAKGMVVVCDHTYLPVGMILPVGTHSTAALHYAYQIEAPRPLKKQLWSSLVRQKISWQGLVLDQFGISHRLHHLVDRVRSGDPENIEGYAAHLYWDALFGTSFRRFDENFNENAYLNYGYTVLRSAVARAICVAGLHPSFGIFHHNQYDSYRLADDMMEPFRPMVDYLVYQWKSKHPDENTLTPEAKRHLISVLQMRVKISDRAYTLWDSLALVMSSLVQSYREKKPLLILPETILFS